MTNEKMFSDIKNFALIFVPINWLISAVVTLILYLTLGSKVGLGYLFGSMTSFLTFGLLMKNTTTLVEQKTSLMKKAMTGNTVRLLISVCMIVVAYYIDNFDFIATIVGVMVLKIILISFVFIRYTFFKDKEEIKDVN